MDKSDLAKYFKENQELWDGYVGLHTKSKFYDVEGFIQGKSSLNFIELDELGCVFNKTMLHLQCHFGLDTLSWARCGVKVTGIDFSGEAIRFANELKTRTQLEAEFMQCNIYELRSVLEQKFDIVFTSYGALAWLPDLKEWAKIIHNFLKKDGIFYIVEFHPVLNMFGDDGKSLQDPYFQRKQPEEWLCKGSYAEPDAEFTHISYQWSHSLSEIINSIIDAQLLIEYVHEFPFSFYGDRPFLIKREDGLWRHKDINIKIPLLFSLKARRTD